MQKGANVTALDNLSTGLKSNLNPKAVFVHGDVLDSTVVQENLQDAELIYHLAADATTRETSMGWKTPVRRLEVNAVGTMNLLQSIVELDLDAKFIFASSAAVYGRSLHVPTNENHPTDPLRKLQADQTKLEVLGTQNVVRDYCYISDLIERCLLLTEKGVPGKVYNISGGRCVTMEEVVNLILSEVKLTGKTRVVYTGKSWKGDIPTLRADSTKIRRLGFRPKVDLPKGIRETIESIWVGRP